VGTFKRFIHRQGRLLVRPLIRTKEEFFSSTVKNYMTQNKPTLVINGNFYDLTNAGLLDVLSGHDPVPAEETTPLGHIVVNGAHVAGSAAPQDFYIAFKDLADISETFLNSVKSGQGNPPTTQSWTGFGGLGPLIINGLAYGRTNKYSKAPIENWPQVGPPPTEAQQFLVQRSSAKFTAFAARDNSSGGTLGKTCIGVSDKELIVYVQEDGSPGNSLESIRDELISLACKHAVFLDGSDSSMLAERAGTLAKQGPDKDESCTIGIAFYWLRG
jgi:hypothetical protein